MADYERSRSLGHLTNWVARLFRKDIQQRLRPLGLMPAHIPILIALSDGSALSQKDLGRWSQTEQPALATAIVRMENSGLLHRSPHPSDGRVSLFSMTDLAREKLPALFAALNQGNDRACSDLSHDEHQTLLVLMHRLIKNLGGVPGMAPIDEVDQKDG